jgi:hypothetical protein
MPTQFSVSNFQTPKFSIQNISGKTHMCMLKELFKMKPLIERIDFDFVM